LIELINLSQPREKKEINSSSEEEEEHDSEGVSEEEASSSPKIQNQASTINNSTSSENPNRAQKSNMKLSDLNDSTGPMNRRERYTFFSSRCYNKIIQGSGRKGTSKESVLESTFRRENRSSKGRSGAISHY
jgi:hypothetical protein